MVAKPMKAELCLVPTLMISSSPSMRAWGIQRTAHAQNPDIRD